MYVAEISSISRVALHYPTYVMGDSVSVGSHVTATNIHSISRFGFFFSRVSFPVAES
jgi:hypothetical protein